MGSLSGYGAEYERPITVPQAKRVLVLAGLASTDEEVRQKLPRMGMEQPVAKHTFGEWPNSTIHLYLQNICGSYVLACAQAEAEDWAELFGESFGLNSDFKAPHEGATA